MLLYTSQPLVGGDGDDDDGMHIHNSDGMCSDLWNHNSMNLATSSHLLPNDSGSRAQKQQEWPGAALKLMTLARHLHFHCLIAPN